jgi:hypothetical protein
LFLQVRFVDIRVRYQGIQICGPNFDWTELLLSAKARKLDKYSDKFWFYLVGKSNLLVEKAIYYLHPYFSFVLSLSASID